MAATSSSRSRSSPTWWLNGPVSVSSTAGVPGVGGGTVLRGLRKVAPPTTSATPREESLAAEDGADLHPRPSLGSRVRKRAGLERSLKAGVPALTLASQYSPAGTRCCCSGCSGCSCSGWRNARCSRCCSRSRPATPDWAYRPASVRTSIRSISPATQSPARGSDTRYVCGRRRPGS